MERESAAECRRPARWSGAIALVLASLVWVVSGPAAASSPGETPKVSLYGFLRVDAIWDDSRMQNHQYAMWVLAEDPIVGPKDASHLTIHPRVTRFGIAVSPAEVGSGVKASGKVEIDFQAGGTESRAGLRMRHAYLELKYKDLAFLGGQTWQLLSPLYPEVHSDGVLWNAGNPGDRAPQIRITYAPAAGKGTAIAAVALGATGAVDPQDLDKNGLLDGASSALPNVQGRLALEQTLYAGRPLKLGLWGHYAKLETDKPVAGKTGWDSWSAGFEFSIPLHARVAVEGEGWTGSVLGDIRGGIGQNVNSVTGTPIDSRGGWAQVATKPTDGTQLYVGVAVDNPRDEDVPSYAEVKNAGLDPASTTGRTLNQVAFLSARYRPWQPFQIACEYYYWVTEYRGLRRGIANRVDLHFSYFF